MDPRRDKLVGIVLVFGAVVAWSATGLFTRLVSVDLWTTLAGRAIAGALLLTALFVWQEGWRRAWTLFAGMKRVAYAHAAASLVCAVATIASLYHTSVANNAVIYASSPFAAAVIARIALGERISGKTLVAATTSLIGVLVVVSGSVGGAHLVGDLIGIVMMLAFAVMIVITRGNPDMPLMPPAILNALLNIAVAAPLADWSSATPKDGLILIVFGCTNFGLAGLLFLYGSRRLPAAEAALIAGLDIVLAPLLVFVVFAETPGPLSLIGGGIVFAAVLGHIVSEVRRPPRPALAE